MDRRGPLLSLARRLEDASISKNWHALEAANADTSRIVLELHAHGPWSASERVALEKLSAAHTRARARCAAELSGVSALVADLPAHREGYLAYAATQQQAELEQRGRGADETRENK